MRYKHEWFMINRENTGGFVVSTSKQLFIICLGAIALDARLIDADC